jgi:hypothetical protein
MVILTFFFLWLLSQPVQYSWWAVLIGMIAIALAGAVFGYQIGGVYDHPDLKYNAILVGVASHYYPASSDYLLYEEELRDLARLESYWLMSHVVVGRGRRRYSAAAESGILSGYQPFPTLRGRFDQGERVPLEFVAGRPGLHLRWELEEDVWGSIAVETGLLAGLPIQRTFDMDRYQRLSFDVLFPKAIAGTPLSIRLEDDSAIRNPNLKVPCSTNMITLSRYLPRPDPLQWSSASVTIPLGLFQFDNPAAYPYDYDAEGMLTCAGIESDAHPDRHHIAQVAFSMLGPSSGELWITNMRFE